MMDMFIHISRRIHERKIVVIAQTRISRHIPRTRSNFSSTSRQIVFCCGLRLIVRTVTTLPSPRPTMFSSVAQVFSRTDSHYPRAPRSVCCDRKRIETSQNLLTKQTIAREYSTQRTLQYATHFSALSRKRSTNQAACLLIW